MSCKDCDKRAPGCHGTCEKYIAYRAKLDEEREQIRKAKEDEHAWSEYVIAKDIRWHHQNRRANTLKSRRK